MLCVHRGCKDPQHKTFNRLVNPHPFFLCCITCRAAPRLRLVALENGLAAKLGGYDGSAHNAAKVAGIAAAVHAWGEALPGTAVTTLHTHMGPGRRLPDFDNPAYETADIS